LEEFVNSCVYFLGNHTYAPNSGALAKIMGIPGPIFISLKFNFYDLIDDYDFTGKFIQFVAEIIDKFLDSGGNIDLIFKGTLFRLPEFLGFWQVLALFHFVKSEKAKNKFSEFFGRINKLELISNIPKEYKKK
jgi:hypothetical protein